MSSNNDPGLGELFRHLVELTDGSSYKWYKELIFKYRPRYTPIMRVLAEGSASVSDLQDRLSISQGAVSQTIKLMLEDGLIDKSKGIDDRQTIVNLTAHGQTVLIKLKPHWEAIFSALEALQQEISLPLMTPLMRSAKALEETSFAERINEAKKSQRSTSNDEQVTKLFQAKGERYLTFRPSYPSELAESLSALTNTKGLVLDVGCGNGQLTKLLAPYFHKVIGIDPRDSQLNHTENINNTFYRSMSAESIELPDNSTDLVVAAQAAQAAQAAHWFDLDKFYAEARRIAKCDAAIALVSYGVSYISGSVNTIFQKAYWQDFHQYWRSERRQVEENYADLYFPFQAINFPRHCIKRMLTAEDFIGYASTWSAYEIANEKGELTKFERFFDRLRNSWGPDELLEVVWPISVKAAKFNQSG